MREAAEVMARAIYRVEHGCQAPDSMDPPFSPKSKIGLAVEGAEATLADLDAAGFAVVPKEPSLSSQYAGLPFCGKMQTVRDAYRAMLAAAQVEG